MENHCARTAFNKSVTERDDSNAYIYKLIAFMVDEAIALLNGMSSEFELTLTTSYMCLCVCVCVHVCVCMCVVCVF